MKISRRLIALFMAVISIVCIAAVPVSAATYIGSVDRKEGGFLGIGATTYTYRAYFDGNYIRYWYGKPLSFVPYHTKGSGSEQLSISKSQSVSYSTTIAFNKSIGANIGINEIVSLSASNGYGVTTGVSFTSTSVKTYTKTIASSAKSGFYMLAPSQTEKKCHWNKYKNSNTTYTGKTGTYYMPYGSSSVCCLYSADNEHWNIFY